jgi:hypothetical protein
MKIVFRLITLRPAAVNRAAQEPMDYDLSDSHNAAHFFDFKINT